MSIATAPNTAEQVALVSAANANQLTSALAQAAIQAAKNEDGTAKFPGFQAAQIPFGSTITVTNTGTSNLGKLAIGLLSTIGLASALLGLVKGAMPAPPAIMPTPISEAPPVAAPPVVPAGSPVTIEGVLNWELTPDGQLSTSVESVEVDPLEMAEANLVAAQQAFVAAQQRRTSAENESLLTGAAPAVINVTLDPDLSTLFNDPSVQANNAYKAVIASLQAVRLAQQAADTLATILTRLSEPPASQPEPSVQVPPALQPATTTTNPQA